jgi:hypothetical protein
VGVGILILLAAEYASKRIQLRRAQDQRLAFGWDHQEMLFYRRGEERLRCPVERIEEVAVHTDSGGYVGTSAGFGITLSDLDEVHLDSEARETFQRAYQKHGMHFWLPSTIIGSEGQNQNFYEWLTRSPAKDRIRDVASDPKTILPWTRESWFIFGFITLFLLGVAVYALAK